MMYFKHTEEQYYVLFPIFPFLASDHYDEKDYIREYENFKELT